MRSFTLFTPSSRSLTNFAVAEWNGRVATQSVSPLIAIKDPKEHLRRRKPWNRALSVASVKEFEPFVSHRAHQLVNELSMHNAGPVNLAQWFSWFTYVHARFICMHEIHVLTSEMIATT